MCLFFLFIYLKKKSDSKQERETKDLQHRGFYFPLNKSVTLCVLSFQTFKTMLGMDRQASLVSGLVLLSIDSYELHTVWYTNLKLGKREHWEQCGERKSWID